MSAKDTSTITSNKRIIEEVTAILSNANSSSSKETMEDTSIINQVTTYIQTLSIEISKVIDSEKNTIIQIYANEKQLQSINIILQSYYRVLIEQQDKQSQFNAWLLNENLSNQTIFEFCVENGYNDIIKLLGKYITNDIANKMLNNRTNVFHCAAKANNIYAILFLYEIFNTNFNIRNSINTETKTKVKPLHLACYSGHSKAVDIIIDLGGDLNAIDSFQMTPLHYAVNASNLRITKKLILYGADKTIKNKDNRTPYEVALLSNQSNLCEILASKTFIQQVFKCQMEYQSLQNRRKDILLGSLIISAIVLQIVFYCVIKLGGNTDRYCNASSSAFVQCLMDFICFIIGIAFELGAIGSVILFHQLRKRMMANGNNNDNNITVIEDIEGFDITSQSQIPIKSQDNSQSQIQSKLLLSEMYLMNDNMCVKCRRNKYDSTIHCIACNICIENWDHHCFWLNFCIHKGNKCYFRIFMVFICGTIAMNLLNCILYLIELGSKNIKALIADVFGMPVDSSGVIILLIIFILVISSILISFLYIIASIIIPFTKDVLYERKQKKIFVINSDKQYKTQALNESRSDIATDF